MNNDDLKSGTRVRSLRSGRIYTVVGDYDSSVNQISVCDALWNKSVIMMRVNIDPEYPSQIESEANDS